MTQQAVIYCRVSSPKQVTEGHGLASQETRCREYAKHKGYDVLDVFRDEGLSGKLLDRPNIKAMLIYLKKHRADNLIVIIDDISRLARDIETHIHLRTAINDANGKLESPSIEFGEDSDSLLVENLLASYDRITRKTEEELIKMLNDGIKMKDPNIKTTIIPSEKEAITHAIKNAVKGSLIVLSRDVIPEALDLVKHFKELELRGEAIEA